MVTIEQVINGLVRFVDADILPQMTGFKKVAMGAYVALAADKLGAQVGQIKHNPAIAMLDLFDEAGNVDIDRLYRAVSDQIGSSKFSIDVPLIGVFTLGGNDVERIYSMIKGG